MHRHRILARFSLILSILNLLLAAPIVVQKLSDAHRNEMVVAEDLETMVKMQRGVEATPDRSMLPRSPTGDPETTSSQHSTLSDEPAASETDSLDSGNSGSLPLTSNPNSNPSASLHDSEFPHPSNLGSLKSLETTEIRPSERLQEFVPAQPAPPLPVVLASPPEPLRHSSTWSSEIQEVPLETTLLAPSHHLTSDEPPPSHSSPPTETPPDDRNFFNKELMKDIGIRVAGALVGGAMIAGSIVGFEHTKHKDR